MNEDPMLKKIITWAENAENIRGLVMEGSRGATNPVDDLADYDINVFCTNYEEFRDQDEWLSDIAKVWVYEPNEGQFEDAKSVNRLVIFEGGKKVDFVFWTIDLVDRMVSANKYDKGCKVLLDKDGILEPLNNSVIKPSTPQKPTQEEFEFIIKEYWFEEYHVAKYLKRKDLWLVKFRDGSIKFYLLKMMEWYMLAKNNWNYDVKWDGKHIEKWLEPEVYDRLFKTYGHFDEKDSWDALNENNDLFRDISKKTAELLAYKYPDEVDKNFTEFTQKLYANSFLNN
jgi:aminoglycoside 6-adenylyltransferase